MQRERGGDQVFEDMSRYQVTLRSPGAKEGTGWTGEVIGPPRVIPLETVNVLASNKKIMVFDKNHKKLWEAPLSYNLAGGGGLDEETAPFGLGPCIERKGSLYVFDEGALAAFDLATGNSRWRLPSIGIGGIFFDDRDNMYVNTSSAGPDKLKYSRQIDISSKDHVVLLKVDSRAGKILWSAMQDGLITYVSGKFIYTMSANGSSSEDEDDAPMQTGLEIPAYLRIKRLDPGNGHQMWEHVEKRSPLHAQFDKNTIRLVFKKEVEVLKFMAL
jgi:hypothetical protein